MSCGLEGGEGWVIMGVEGRLGWIERWDWLGVILGDC